MLFEIANTGGHTLDMYPAFPHAACQASLLLVACSLQEAQADTCLPWGLLQQGKIQAPFEGFGYRKRVPGTHAAQMCSNPPTSSPRPHYHLRNFGLRDVQKPCQQRFLAATYCSS